MPAKKSPDVAPLPLVLAGAAVAFFFTQGLPLWNDDYSQWEVQGQASVATLIARILLPITWDPNTWGFGDRPLQVLMYRVLHFFFADWGTGYYFAKSVAFGALGWTIARWMRKLGVSTLLSWLTLALFALSANAVAAMVWQSDYGVYSQALLAWLLFEALGELKTLTPSSQRFERVFAIFFCVVYFGSKIRGDIRLAPLVLLAYLACYDRKKLKALWPWLAGTFAATLPWSLTTLKHLPPFVGGSGYSGWTYGRFSLLRLLRFLVGDALSWHSPPVSLLGGMGIVVGTVLVFGAVREGVRRSAQWMPPQAKARAAFQPPGKELGLVLIWFALALLVMGIIAPINGLMEHRYTLIVWVPAAALLARALESLFRELRDLRARQAFAALLVVQCLLQIRHAVHVRKDLGHLIVGVDGVYTAVEAKHPDARFLLGPGFVNYGFRSSPARALNERSELGDINAINGYQPLSTFVASWTPTLDTRLSVDTFASGCTLSAFDVFFPCLPTDGAFLFKYVGTLPDLANADALDKKGDLRGARQILESYWQRDPQNHGVAFSLGLYDYRLQDFAAMERVYDGFARYFPAQSSVVYNWGLAKAGGGKDLEAASLFERAYALSPLDYGIGFNLADTYYKLGKRSRAVTLVNDLIKAFPGNDALTRARQRYESP